MYKMLLALAAVAVMACGSVAGEVSQSTLSDMGLAGMQSMSDEQGSEVRGAWAFGGSFAYSQTGPNVAGSAFTAGDLGPGWDLAVTSTYAGTSQTVFVPFVGLVTVGGTAYSAGIGIAGP